MVATQPLATQGAVLAPRPRRRLQGKDWAPYAFLAPTLIFFVVFFLVPIGFSLYLTFTNWNPLSTPEFIGLENYRFLLEPGSTFFRTLVNTLVFSVGTVVVGIPLALVVAFVFSQSRLKGLWRSLYWLPMITNIVAVAYLWQFILDGRYGLFNRALGWFGIVGPNWLTEPYFDMAAVIIVAIWLELGKNMVVFSAGLEGIDESYYEAAKIDGATLPQIFRKITIPLLQPTLLFVSITTFIGGMGTFALILVMTDSSPSETTNVTALYMYQMAFQDLRMGRASTVAFLLFIVILILTLVQLRLFRRGGVESY